MNKCPFTYEWIPVGLYAPEGLAVLHRSLKALNAFPYSAPEQRTESVTRMTRMSVQGMQTKISANLNVRAQNFEIVDTQGHYIIKPQSDLFPHMPENEDLTMHMAQIGGIEVPWHGLIWCKDGSLSYVIKRFDRSAKGKKWAVEDFSQLAKLPRQSKYDYTTEKLIKLLHEKTTFPKIESVKFFRLLLFCFLTGNEDMHLKNFSLIQRNNKVELAPAYDLLNSTLVLGKTADELALMLAGKRRELQRRELVDYLGMQKLMLTSKSIDQVLAQLHDAQPIWEQWIKRSFLPEALQIGYQKILSERCNRLW